MTWIAVARVLFPVRLLARHTRDGQDACTSAGICSRILPNPTRIPVFLAKIVKVSYSLCWTSRVILALRCLTTVLKSGRRVLQGANGMTVYAINWVVQQWIEHMVLNILTACTLNRVTFSWIPHMYIVLKEAWAPQSLQVHPGVIYHS